MVALERLSAGVDADLLRALIARHRGANRQRSGDRPADGLGGGAGAFWKVAPKRQGDAPEVGNGLLESLLHEVQSQPVAL
jgi:hypothetical protein